MNGISLLIYFFQVSFLRIFDGTRLRATRLRRDVSTYALRGYGVTCPPTGRRGNWWRVTGGGLARFLLNLNR